MLTKRHVVGTYLKPDGSPRTGYVEFTPNVVIVKQGEAIIYPTTIRADLDANGKFEIDLLVTDDVDWEPNGWLWYIEEKFDTGISWYLEVLNDVGDLDITNLYSLGVVPPSYPVQGPAGPAGADGADGAQGPAGGSVISGWWQFKTATTGPALTGEVRIANAWAVGYSQTVYLHPTDNNGLDWSLVTVEINDRLVLRSVSGESATIKITSVPGNTEIIGTVLSVTSNDPKKNELIEVSVVRDTSPKIIFLAPGDPVPAGTPADTLVVRR